MFHREHEFALFDLTEKLIVVFGTNHYSEFVGNPQYTFMIVTIMRISRFSRASVGEISASSSSDGDSDDNPGHKLREIRVEDDETKKKRLITKGNFETSAKKIREARASATLLEKATNFELSASNYHPQSNDLKEEEQKPNLEKTCLYIFFLVVVLVLALILGLLAQLQYADYVCKVNYPKWWPGSFPKVVVNKSLFDYDFACQFNKVRFVDINGDKTITEIPGIVASMINLEVLDLKNNNIQRIADAALFASVFEKADLRALNATRTKHKRVYYVLTCATIPFYKSLNLRNMGLTSIPPIVYNHLAQKS